ncbi:MAG: dicarboxylate/amino acid:cation symporter, partial [Candidatus Tectomicrobia bacterium]|nr:dicarboxylate/amino acid:cation symporter [Candidatus Tectomicrobia bacterium]
VVGIAIGFFIGFYLKPAAQVLAPFGQIYVSLLMMCVIPIVITSMTSGVARLVRTVEIRDHLWRLTAYFLAGLLLPGGIGVLAAWIGGPGENLSASAMSSLGTLVLDSDSTSNGPSGLLPFLISIVPRNIFASLSSGHIVSIVFACVLIGLALGLVPNQGAEEIVQFIDVIFDSFNLIFRWVLSLLPIGLACLLAGQLTNLSPGVFQALVKFIVVFYLTAVGLALVYYLLLWRVVGGRLWHVLKALGKPLFVAYMVDSSLVALSSCLEVLEQRLGVDKRMSGLILPFGMIANRHGKICLFAFTAVFLAQIHNVTLSIGDVLVVLIASSLTGMAAVGSGVVLASSLIVVVHTIAVPDVLAPVVLIAAGPIIDRMQSALTVLANCTLAAVAAKLQKA